MEKKKFNQNCDQFVLQNRTFSKGYQFSIGLLTQISNQLEKKNQFRSYFFFPF